MHAFGEALEGRDVDALMSLLAEDVLFRSPVVHRPYRGRDAVMPLLAAVGQVLEDFRYTREMGEASGRDNALVFAARVGDRELEGCDFIHTDCDGRVDELYVMVRPLSGLVALAEAMQRQLAV